VIKDRSGGNLLSADRTYHAYKIEALARFMAEEGVAPEQTLAETGLSFDTLSLPDTRTSLQQLATVFHNMMEHGNDPTIALRAGQHMRVSNYGLYGYALLSSASLRKTLDFAVRCHKLATPTTTMLLEEHGDVASFSMTDALGVDELHRFNLEFQLSLVFSLTKDILGSQFRYDSVRLSYNAPEHCVHYEEILQCRALFDQPRSEFQFPRELLDRPLLRSNVITEAMVNELCDNMMKEQAQQTDLTRKIYDLLLRDPGNMPSSEHVASTLAITARTLRRKLESQGTCYQAIVDEVRKELSIKFLRQTELSVDDIATQVGFSDAANFRNAFKRWTNKTPGMYRP